MNNYTHLFSLRQDLLLFLANYYKEPITLDIVPALASSRFVWIVDNWKKLRPIFFSVLNGDKQLDSSFKSLENYVKSWRMGSRKNPFDNINLLNRFAPFLSTLTVESISPTPEETNFINLELKRVSEFTIDSFKKMIEFLRNQRVFLSNDIGLNDPNAAKITGIAPTRKIRSATLDDLESLEGYVELIQMIQGIIFDLQQRADRPPNLLAWANLNLDDESGVSVDNAYRSSVSVPFEISLEHMAKKYLGDSKKVYELVTINQLQPPFVDNYGTKVKLSTPAAKNSVIIPSTHKKSLHVGSKVRIGSAKHAEELRLVEQVLDNKNNSLTLLLSGENNLSRFVPKDNAYIRVYAPATITEGDFINMPLYLTSPVQLAKTPNDSRLRRLDRQLLQFGVDIARNHRTNDALVDENGNFVYQFGLSNVRQAVLYALRTSLGELPMHPNYGFSDNIGSVFYGSDTETEALSMMIQNTILRDSRFSDAVVNKISLTPNSISIQLVVFIVGSDIPVPLTYTV